MMPPRVSAIILAAGTSSRMEGRHKLTLDVGGVPMIRRIVQAVLGIAPAETIVVTGYAADAVIAALDGLPVRFVHNPRYAEGQPGSVAAGVRSLQAFCNAVMIVPGDQALLTVVELNTLITAYASADHAILVPFHDGQRGNPVLFAASYIPEVAGGGLNVGCRRLIETKADEVTRVEFASDAFTFDCDTPADYAELLRRVADGPQAKLPWRAGP